MLMANLLGFTVASAALGGSALFRVLFSWIVADGQLWMPTRGFESNDYTLAGIASREYGGRVDEPVGHCVSRATRDVMSDAKRHGVTLTCSSRFGAGSRRSAKTSTSIVTDVLPVRRIWV